MLEHIYLKNILTRLRKHRKFDSKNIIILTMMLNFVFVCFGFCQEKRSPFKDWFPKIKIELNKTEEEPVIFVEPEKVFDSSLYNVEGLIWATNKPKAIINNQIYGIGDKLGEAEIIKIDKEGVTLIFDEKEYVITTQKKIDIKK